jgi:hypothetical protein
MRASGKGFGRVRRVKKSNVKGRRVTRGPKAVGLSLNCPTFNLQLFDSSFANLGVVANIHAFHEEDDIFGNIGGVISDALEVAGDEHQVEALANG